MNIQKLGTNQLSINTGDRLCFMSYETLVCEVTNFEDGNEPIVKITEGQPQSKTTAKYLNEFFELHGIHVPKIKKIKKVK